jgi:putative NIF3 family GTP cyclohydrolase 1 type 2
MATVSDIVRYVETMTGHPIMADEGVQHGPADRVIFDVTLCWMADPSAIQAAGASRSELLIGHESLYYPYDVVNSTAPPPGWPDWQTNRQRTALLDRYDLTFLRLHGSLDEVCIFDDFAARLDLGAPVTVDGLVKIYEIEECTLAQLVGRVKDKLGMATLRVSQPETMRPRIRRVGLPWGGLGLFVNVAYQQRLIEQGCDAFIAGESDNYGFRFSAECGIPMIETSHEISENPGLRHFTAMLADAFPAVRVHFFENPCAWSIV